MTIHKPSPPRHSSSGRFKPHGVVKAPPKMPMTTIKPVRLPKKPSK